MDVASRRIDVHRDLFLGVFRLKEEQLGGDQTGHAILDSAGHKDDPVLQKARKDVVGALATAGLLHHHGDQVHGLGNHVVHGGIFFSGPIRGHSDSNHGWD